jgi:hypothetical protein
VQGQGLALRIIRNINSPLRAQLVEPNSAGDNTRWCAELSQADPQLLAYSGFNTACWNNSGTEYQAVPLRSVAVVVPGSNVADVPFDFCIAGFADANAAQDATLQ